MKKPAWLLIITLFTAVAAGFCFFGKADGSDTAGAANEQYNTVVRESYTVKVSSTIASATSANQRAEHMFSGTASTYWTSEYYAVDQRECFEWILITFDAPQKVSAVTLGARANGVCFPSDFRFVQSMSGNKDIDIEGQNYTGYSFNAAGTDNVFTFSEPVVCKYLKLYITKRGEVPTSGNHLVSFSKLDISFAGASADEVAAANLADGETEQPKVIYDTKLSVAITASTENTEDKNVDWSMGNLSDGTLSSSWCSEWVGTASEIDNIWILMAADSPQKFTGAILYSSNNICFPRSFWFEYSLDEGTTFLEIPDSLYTDYDTASGDGVRHVFAFPEPVIATHIRINITKKTADPNDNYLVQLAEAEARGLTNLTQAETDAAISKFNEDIGNLPDDPNAKPAPIPVGPDDFVCVCGEPPAKTPSDSADTAKGCASVLPGGDGGGTGLFLSLGMLVLAFLAINIPGKLYGKEEKAV